MKKYVILIILLIIIVCALMVYWLITIAIGCKAFTNGVIQGAKDDAATIKSLDPFSEIDPIKLEKMSNYAFWKCMELFPYGQLPTVIPDKVVNP